MITNTKLEKLFTQYNFSLKDKHDFMQIFSLLPDYKKRRVVENFDEIAQKLSSLRDDLQVQQEILFWKTLSNIESKLEEIQKSYVQSKVKEDISLLKSML